MKLISSPFPAGIEWVSFTAHSRTCLHNSLFTIDNQNSLIYSVFPQNTVGTKTISVNTEKWKLPSNITEFSSKLPIMYFFFHK